MQAQIIINAAGPWIDIVNHSFNHKTEYIGGTKGSHLVLNHPELRQAIGENEFFFENKDGRIVLIYPFLKRVLVGTSDLPINDPDQAVCTEEEIDYFLSMIKIVFPKIAISREQIAFQFSGVRPLPASNSAVPGQISRDHQIAVFRTEGFITNMPVLNLIGGKWTAFRAFAEQAANQVLTYLGRERVVNTDALAIGGGRAFPLDPEAQQFWLENLAKESGLGLVQLSKWLDRYGTLSAELVRFILLEPDQPLKHHPDYSMREILWLIERESVVHLEDILMRRTQIGMQGEITFEGVEEICRIAADGMAWTEEEQFEEIERLKNMLSAKHGIKL
ncbi:MAG: FAD-dependent oxidoreductase [Chloroflexota bacterium]